MNKGNSYAGIISRKDYFSLWIYPLGIQAAILDDMILFSFVIDRLDISLSFKRNYNLFLD